MTELCTARLDFEQLDAEVLAIVEAFRRLGVETAYVSLGYGCSPDVLIQSEVIPVRVADLIGFLEEGEANGWFELGESNIHVAGGGLGFLLCHEQDVHCSGEESAALTSVRNRWARIYPTAYERRSGGQWHRLASRPGDSHGR